MEKLKNYLILGLALTVMVLGLLKCDGKVIKETYVVENDCWDTIHTPPITVLGPIRYVPGIVIVDSFPVHDTAKLELCRFTRTYIDSIADSNQVIKYTAKTTGTLDSIKIDYTIKSQDQLIHTITQTKESIKSPKWDLYGGLRAGGTKDGVNLGPIIALRYKNKILAYDYDIINKSHNISTSFKIFGSKK